MMNLLPLAEKQKLLDEKKLKQVMILSLVFFFFLICLTLILFSIQINLRSQLAFKQAILAQKEREFESSEAKGLEEEIIFFNRIFVDISSFNQEKFLVSDILAELSKTIPNGISLANFSFQKQGKEISLSGNALTREDLLALKKNLEENENFQEVYFPASNWINPVDINFLAKFTSK